MSRLRLALVLVAALAAGAAAQDAPNAAAQDAPNETAQQPAAGPAQDTSPAQDDAALPQPSEEDLALARSALGDIGQLVDAEEGLPGAVLIYSRREIAPLRVRVFGRTPEERAEAATHQLDRLVEAHTIEPIFARRLPGGAILHVAGKGVIGIADADLAGGEGTVEEQLHRIEAALDTALREAVEARSPRQLMLALLWAGLALALLVIVMRALFALSANLQARYERLSSQEDARQAGKALDATGFGAHWLRTAGLRLARMAIFAACLMCVWVWLTYTLLQFPYLRPMGESLDENLEGLAFGVLDGALGAIPDLIVAVLILVAGRFIVRGSNSFFDAVAAGRVTVPWIDRDVAKATRKLVAFGLWVFAVVLAYPYVPGSDTEAFKGITVFLGLVLSFGATGTVGQAVSGLMLMYSRILRVGDYVRIGTAEGTVTQINLLATRLRTVFDEELVIPNTVVMAQTTQNFSRFRDAGGVRMTTEVTIGYDAPWRQVHAMLLRAAALTPGVRAHPAPEVLQTELADFYVRYRLTVCVEVPDLRIPVLSALHRNIQDQFNEHGVQIMSPHFMVNPPQRVVVPREQWRAAPADPAGL
jgi:small-conductance mechanosensitive channel